MRKTSVVASVLLTCSGLLLSGCDSLPKEIQPLWQKVQLEARNVWATLTGTPVSDPQAAASPTAPSEEEAAGKLLSAGQRAQANAELFHEIYQVVFAKEPEDRGQFGSWVDTLNQGASLEGVHNGLIHSAEFRKLESESGSAAVKALMSFAEELAILELNLSQPTLFDPVTGAALRRDDEPSAAEAPTGLQPSPSPAPITDEMIQQYSDQYAKQFVTFSVYALKRVLCNEAIRVINEKNSFKENLAIWYSKWAVRMAGKGVDFGIPLRNNKDEAFHYAWAVKSTDDRIKWEVLNRIHRVLNTANELDKE